MKNWTAYEKEMQLASQLYRALEPLLKQAYEGGYNEGFDAGMEEGYTQCESEYNEAPK